MISGLIKMLEHFLNSFSIGRKVLPTFQAITKWLLFHRWALKNGLKLRFNGKTVELTRGNKKFIFSREQMFFFWDVVANFDEYFDAFEVEQRGEVSILDFSEESEQTIKSLGVPLLIPGVTEGDWTLKGYVEKYLPKVGDVVFDCGAYCGIATYYFSQLVGPTGKVYAFEPDESNYQVLLKNIEKHHVIEGAKEFLKDKNVHFAIASYHLRDGEPTSQKLERMFAAIGYQSETGFPRQTTTWAARAL